MKFFYKLLIFFLILISPIIIILRIIKKKENPKRFLEKFAFSSKIKKNGKLVWIHCSSVGELLSVIPLLNFFENSNKIQQILVTSSTLSSSKLFEKFKFKKTTHQFYPIDSSFIVKKFLNQWQPNLVFFVESEIWPEMIDEIKKRKIKIFLINARISRKSFKKWNKIKNFASTIFNKFDFIYPQNNETTKYLKMFNVKKVKMLGNLKFIPTTKPFLNRISKNFFTNKNLLCIASTHPNEEKIFIDAHSKLKEKINNILTIIIPRHIERTGEICDLIKKNNFNFINHSSKKKINKSTDFYIVDTYGESESFYSLSNVVFLGGSLVQKGGQNPLEPLRFGCSLLHGKNVDNFKDIYKMLEKKNLSTLVYKNKNIYKTLAFFLKKRKNEKKIIHEFRNLGKQVLKQNLSEIKKFI